MLSASIEQQVAVRPVTSVSRLMLVVTILLGTSVPLSLSLAFAPGLVGSVTLLWFALYIAAIGGLFLTHGVNWISWIIRYRILLVVLILGSLAIIPFSVDPALSAVRYTHFLGTTILAIYLGFSVSPVIIGQTFTTIVGIMLVLSLGAISLLPEIGLEFHNGSQVWRGIFDNKNTMGFWAAVAVLIFPSLTAWSSSRLARLCCIAGLLLALLFVYKSHSAGSMIALTCAAATMIYMHVSQQLRLGALAMFLLAGLTIAISIIIVSQVDVASIAGRSSDLTGRGEVWEQTWKLVQQKPITGYGYGTIWSPTDETIWIQQRYTDFSWVVYHAHNGVLQLASEVGLPLTALALLFVLQQLVEIIFGHYKLRHTGALFVVGFVVAYVVSNYSEARFMQSRELFWIFFIALPISLVRQAKLSNADALNPVPPSILATSLNNPLHQSPSAQYTVKSDPTILEYSELKLQRETKKARRERRSVLLRLPQHDAGD